MHHFVIKQECFPFDPKDALIRGFKAAEEVFLGKCKAPNKDAPLLDRSGSCATVILIVGDHCYSANVGDSRSILSINGGQIVMPLSIDHKPSEMAEYQRIIKAGG